MPVYVSPILPADLLRDTAPLKDGRTHPLEGKFSFQFWDDAGLDLAPFRSDFRSAAAARQAFLDARPGAVALDSLAEWNATVMPLLRAAGGAGTDAAGDRATKYAITHPEQGIYVGSAMGLGFWSNWEAAGQDRAAVFDSEADAREHVSSWADGNDPDAYGYAAVAVAPDAHHATADELREAGLGDLLGELAATVPVRGRA